MINDQNHKNIFPMNHTIGCLHRIGMSMCKHIPHNRLCLNLINRLGIVNVSDLGPGQTRPHALHMFGGQFFNKCIWTIDRVWWKRLDQSFRPGRETDETEGVGHGAKRKRCARLTTLTTNVTKGKHSTFQFCYATTINYNVRGNWKNCVEEEDTVCLCVINYLSLSCLWPDKWPVCWPIIDWIHGEWLWGMGMVCMFWRVTIIYHIL